MDLEVVAYERMGAIGLGASVDEVRKKIGSKCVRVRTYDSVSGLARDHFPEQGIFVEYRRPGICVSIEATSPANPIFRGRQLLTHSYSEIRSWLESIGGEVKLESSVLKAFAFGIALYTPFCDEEPETPPEGVMLFERGYYERDYS